MSIEDTQELPAGWKWVKLGDVCRVASGSTPASGVPEYWDGDICWITPTDLGRQTSHLVTDSARRITKAGFDNSGTEMVPVGSVVMSSRAPIGHLGIATVPLCTNQGCKCFVPGNDVDTHFLFYALKMAVPALQALGSGATFAEVSKSQVQAFSIPLPPLPEQKRIAAILTEKLAAVNKARTAAEARLKAAKELPAAYLREVFESEEAQSWPTVALGDAGEVVSGVTLGRKLSGTATREVPYLRVANVKDGHLDLSDVKTIEVTESEIQRWRLQPGDLLLTEGGDPDKLGRGSFWSDEIPECIHQNHIFRVRFPQDKFLPEFLSAQMSSGYGKAYFLAHAKQTTGIATINQQVLKAFPLRVPSIEVQRQFADSITLKIIAANQLSSMLEEELAAIKSMPAANLRQAFLGET